MNRQQMMWEADFVQRFRRAMTQLGSHILGVHPFNFNGDAEDQKEILKNKLD